MTRKYTTAFTFTVTLSRVTTSCGGTSSVSMRSETRTMRSGGAKTKMTPGPFGSGSRRPREKRTPRSYSRRIFMELSRYRITTAITTNTASFISASSLLEHRFHSEFQLIDGCNPDAGAGRRGARGDRVPVFAMNEYFSRGRQVGHGRP